TDITIEVVANSTGACGPSSAEATCTANNCESVTIAIEPVENICLDASVQPFDLVPTIIGGMGNGQLTWSGTGIINSNTGTFDPQQGVFGENIVTALYVEGNCTYTEDFSIHLFDLPVASFTTNAPVCEGDEMTVTYPGPLLPGLMFEWDFGGGIAVPGTGPGPHQVTWPGSGTHNISLLVQNANGCISEPFEAGVQVEQPFTAPPVSCSSTTSSVQFTWPTVTGATDYQVEVTSGQTGVFTPPNSFLLDGLSPNEEVNIELTIVGNGTCPPVVVQQSCVAIDCPPTDLIIAPQNGSACISSSNPVDFELTANVPGPTTVTWSGNGITDTEEGLFDPSTAGIGQHIITVVVENGNCSYSNSTTIEVIGEPLADFTATPVICESDVASLVYLGNASVDAHYSWDLDGGTLDSNQLTVSWDAPGTYNLSLQVEQDGCVSQPFTQTVEVTPELAEPLISCDATTDAVEFTWADVPGATDYQVTILSGPVGTYTPPGTYLVEGLMPGDEVTIEVTVNGNTVCDAPTVTFSCTANDCPDVSLFLTPPGPVCESNATAPFPLEATVSGGSGNGSGTWSGPGVVNGGFDASIAGEGLHTLIFTYEENANCTYTESISVEVVPPPVADAGAGGTLTCEPGGMDVQLGGNANPSGNNISYLWQADFGAFPGDSTILHPVVALPGTYTLTVTDTDLGCSSTDVVVVEASQEIPVPDLTLLPISCYGNNDGAIIINSVSGGQEPYLFSLNGSPFGSNSSFTQLPPAIYEVQILDANGCENLLTFDIRQPQELDVSLVLSIEGNNVITLGDEITMTGIVTLPEDSLDIIRWSPPELVSCDSCLQVIAQPVQQTTFTLTVESNGCEDSESVTVFVAKDWQVFVPNAFSPNGDNINDRFRIFVNAEQVTEVKSFLIFNRWGETVFQFYGFDPNDPNTGWDGTFRGKPLNPAVFVWFAEVEFIDGSTRLFEGDVTLIR
ncbi:MAG TPA: T9SS type B sorting domain-containing protein, partial [Bacteroidetes bacterium]|nr:T9SS type B sorting domain-containing protein [Bacteroidota bacterium]